MFNHFIFSVQSSTDLFGICCGWPSSKIHYFDIFPSICEHSKNTKKVGCVLKNYIITLNTSECFSIGRNEMKKQPTINQFQTFYKKKKFGNILHTSESVRRMIYWLQLILLTYTGIQIYFAIIKGQIYTSWNRQLHLPEGWQP